MKTAIKSFRPEFKSVADDGTVVFVVATLKEIDSDGDVTLPGYFGKQDVVVLPAHDRHHVPLGKGSLEEVGDEAIATVKFNLEIEAARDWHSSIKFDFANPPSLQEYSYGYSVLPGGSKSGDFAGQRVRFLQPKADGTAGVDVYEVSPVVKGAGVSTRTLAAKAEKQPNSEIQTALRNAGRDRWGDDTTWVYVEDYDVDELWAVFCVSPDAAADRLVRVDFTRDDTGGITLADAERDVERTVGYMPKSDSKFTEHVKTVLADVDVLHTRATEVMALRAVKGKALGDEAKKLLDELVSSVARFEDLVVAAPGTDPTDDVDAEFLRYVALTRGA